MKIMLMRLYMYVQKVWKHLNNFPVTYHRCLLDSHCQNINENSFCFDNDNNRVGRCKCIDGYELLSRNRTFFACLQNAGWEEPCEKNIQCYSTLSTDAVCDGVCKCAEGAHRFTDGRCYQSIRLGDFCQTGGNCLLSDGTFGNCIDGKCDCKFDRQIPTEDAMSCVEARNLGEICDNNDQCSSIPYAVCRVSCRCAPGYALSRDGTRCLETATQFFDPCEENAQCSEFLQGSFCNNGNCTCEDTHHGYGTRCTRSAGLGGTCSGMEECIPDPRFSNVANCIDGTCQCLPGTVDETIGCNSCRVYYNLPIISVCLLYLFSHIY
ncbi:multiple epidermal growth factor-like domains protein 10 [Anoplophora glabripennis]|uniref:multiple epidermal growth factor-like domains protein 10 n=1 Tax=Anoplophora glabripennis TaxID=217634 RepID=UPI000C773A1D|nr:multiple epidermal growth factor-like domains protein 10 [Anoplophora glabripennis]